MAIQPALSALQVSRSTTRRYTVKHGDSLASIARTQLGDTNRWHDIYNLNRSVIGPNPNKLQPGMVLRLPARTAHPAPTPAPHPTPAPRPTPRPTPRPSQGLDVPGAIRVGSPLLVKVGTWLADKLHIGGFGGGSAGGVMDPGGFGPVDPGVGPVDPGAGSFSEGLSGGFTGGASGAIGGALDTVKNALSTGAHALVSGLKRNVLFAAATSAISNGLAFLTHKETGKQAASGFIADTGAYAAIGSASTFVGAAIGTLIPVPFVGTAIGMVAGMGLGYLYEKLFRKKLTSTVQHAVFH